jgi:hypothetical protein
LGVFVFLQIRVVLSLGWFSAIFSFLAKKLRVLAFYMADSHNFFRPARRFCIRQNAERAEIFLYNLDKLPLNTVYSIGFDRSCIRPVQGLGFSAGPLWRMLFGMYL